MQSTIYKSFSKSTCNIKLLIVLRNYNAQQIEVDSTYVLKLFGCNMYSVSKKCRQKSHMNSFQIRNSKYNLLQKLFSIIFCKQLPMRHSHMKSFSPRLELCNRWSKAFRSMTKIAACCRVVFLTPL